MTPLIMGARATTISTHVSSASCLRSHVSSQIGVTTSAELEHFIPDHGFDLEQAYSLLTLSTDTASNHQGVCILSISIGMHAGHDLTRYCWYADRKNQT